MSDAPPKDEYTRQLLTACIAAREDFLTLSEKWIDRGTPPDGPKYVYALYVALRSLSAGLETAFTLDELLSLDAIAESFTARDIGVLTRNSKSTAGRGGDA